MQQVKQRPKSWKRNKETAIKEERERERRVGLSVSESYG
jgi:hypothetical protein